MHSIEVVLAMLLAVVASGYRVRTVPISISLPPLLFLDGWRISACSRRLGVVRHCKNPIGASSPRCHWRACAVP
jgi:hypothetical protein